MTRSLLTILGTTLILATPTTAQVEAVGLRVDMPEAAPFEAEDAAASAAANMVQSILEGEDEGRAWAELETVLEERSMTRSDKGAEVGATGGDSAGRGAAAEWARLRSTIVGETPWTVETGIIVAIGFLLVVALLSTLVGAVRRRGPVRSRLGLRRRAPAASDAVRLAERLGTRRA